MIIKKIDMICDFFFLNLLSTIQNNKLDNPCFWKVQYATLVVEHIVSSSSSSSFLFINYRILKLEEGFKFKNYTKLLFLNIYLNNLETVNYFLPILELLMDYIHPT